ncbi:HD domain-containing phosphohydrolase [Amphritea sp. HPY]|uniref:HD-GYP domain-containing protein n=1 Tax=Amphritea sp. HPY TaxID=3421652 RepID=UPI003D7CA39A
MDSIKTVVLLVALDPDAEQMLQQALPDEETQILSAEGLEQALAMIGTDVVHIVVLDQRQGEDLALEYLQQLKTVNNDLEGFLLTTDYLYQPQGQVAADGLIHHYIEFPSDPQILAYRMRQAVRVARLKQELEGARTDFDHDMDAQRSQFRRRQQHLVGKIQASEAEVARSHHQLDKTNQQLADGYRQVIRMFSNIALHRMGQRASGQNQLLNRMVADVAQASSLGEAERKHLTMAWMLRSVGKLSFSDHLLATPYLMLSPEQQREFHSHPDHAYAMMTIVRPLNRAAAIVRQHKEYLDGSGYPQGLKADQISLGAQLLALLNDYTELIGGLYHERQLSTAEALEYLRVTACERYNQTLVDILQAVLSELAPVTDLYTDQLLSTVDLQPGMVLTRDLISKEGVLLLGEGEILDQETIERIRELEFNFSEFFQLYIELR